MMMMMMMIIIIIIFIIIISIIIIIIMILMACDISEIFSKSSPSVTPHSPSTNVLKEETTMVLGFSRQMFFPKSLRNPLHLRKKKLYHKSEYVRIGQDNRHPKKISMICVGGLFIVNHGLIY